MSAAPDSGTGLPAGACPVCATPVADLLPRCPECGLDLAGVAPRPSAYSRVAVAWTIIGFAAVYAAIVLAVALAN
ncbi:MAG: hypothetical protein ACKOA9_11250 [Actinomycetota bacterium]